MWVYKITNLINDKGYVGITTNLELRWKAHKKAYNYPYIKNPLYSAMRKYGLNNFKFEIIRDNIGSTEELGELERYYIKQYNTHISQHGYNLTWGGERCQYDANPRTSLTVEDIVEIRTIYDSCTIGVKKCWQKYSDRISYQAFEKIWENQTWKGIMEEVYTEENKAKHRKDKSNRGEKNGNALYTDEEVLQIRKFYVNHPLSTTYERYGSKSKSKVAFRNIVDKGYTHIPIYSKVRKQWILNKAPININNFNPVSTIPVSRE